MNTTENNKLIAEFMGYALYEGYSYIVPHYDSYVGVDGNMHETPIHHIHSLKFHTSWDWLMPVVHKIVADYEFNEQEELSDNEYRESLMDIVPFGIISDVYESVVEFIKWYNENKKN